MKNAWYVCYYKYVCNGKEYYCSCARGYNYYSPLPIHDASLVDMRPCETKRDAERIANLANLGYKEAGTLATTDNLQRRM